MYMYFDKKRHRAKSNYVNIFWEVLYSFISNNFLLDEEDDASKEETDDVLTDANQGGSEDAIEEDQNNTQIVSDQRKNSDTSDEVQSFRDRRQVKIIRVRISHSRDTRLIDFKIRV